MDDYESTLLLANVEAALRELDRDQTNTDMARSMRSLEFALETYGSVKHLLPKLDLSADQRASVESKLSILRARIVT